MGNDLIYEAITGQTRDPTEGPNKFTPLNTPIISASIAEKYAIINLVGVMLRFVSLDNGVTTPSHFNIPSSNLYTIKNNLIWDIYLDGFVANEVGALPDIIFFSNHDDDVIYFMRDKNIDNYYEFFDTTSIFIFKLKVNHVIDDYCSIDESVQLIGKFDTSATYSRLCCRCCIENYRDMIAPEDYIYVYYRSTIDSVSWYNTPTKYIYVYDTHKLVNFVRGSDDGISTSVFNSYNISKAWLYDNNIIAVTTNNLVLVVGDNTNHRLTPDNDNDYISSPYIIGVGNPADFIIDKGSDSYYILYDTLTESNNKLNIKQNTYSDSLKISNLTQIQDSGNKIGKQITQSDFHTKTAITLPGSNEVIWFRWDVQIPANTGNEDSITVTLGPYIEWDYDPDLI